MPRWTPEQDELLYSYSSLGASEVARAIRKEVGIKHTEAAVVKRASRLGITLTRYQTCPRCGARVRRLDYRGMCRECFVTLMLEVERVTAEELDRMPETERKEQELRALRRRNERRVR